MIDSKREFKLNAKKYIVIECKGHDGLTVGSFSRKPGYIFSENDWTHGDAALRKAVAAKRCQPVKEDKK